MTVDEVILKALEGGSATVNDITKRFERLMRIKLEKLRVRGVVVREGRGGAQAGSSHTNYYAQTAPRRRSTRRAAVSRGCKSDTRTAIAGRYASCRHPARRPRPRGWRSILQRKPNCRPRQSFEPRQSPTDRAEGCRKRHQSPRAASRPANTNEGVSSSPAVVGHGGEK